jgi:hypothetical protein
VLGLSFNASYKEFLCKNMTISDKLISVESTDPDFPEVNNNHPYEVAVIAKRYEMLINSRYIG